MIITPESLTKLNWQKTAGLLPAIVQDNTTGQVLMMAWMNEEALTITLQTGKATFFSRSRQCLWCKGETSGNTLYVKQITADCDQDTLLLQAEASGPACHKGTVSCWSDSTEPSFTFLKKLDQLLEARKESSEEESYTASLYLQGIKRIAQKVGEEGVETALAAMTGNRDEIINESADLLYHLMVLLKSQELSVEDVIICLKKRHLACR